MVQKLKNIKFESLIFFISLLFSANFSKLFYNSYYSPDFEKYVMYIDYFTNRGGSPNLDQGVIYFYIISLFLNNSKNLINPNNQELIYSNAIQNANLLLYVIGLIGLYKLLKIYKYKKNDIYLLFSILNLLPIMFAVRVTMKPEILAFSLIPWVIYFLKMYLIEKDFLYLYYLIPILSILFTSKGSILGLTVILVLVFFGKEIINILKNHTTKGIATILVFIIFLVPIYMENNSITNSGVLSYEPPEEYKNTAPINIIYNFNLNNFLNDPVRNSQSGSFLGLTLLDTFGDYFQLYWEYEYSLTNTSRKEILKSGDFLIDFNYKEIFLPVNERYLNLEYYRIYISVLLTLIFYIYAIRKIFSKSYNNEQKIFLILPFAGMSLLLFQVVTGIPAQNWDPSKGDTLKPFYYSFLFVLSFSFLIIEIIKSLKKKYRMFLIISVFFLYIFIMGFPKANNSSFDNAVIYKNQHLITCEINNIFLGMNLFEKENIDCKQNYKLFCDESLFDDYEIYMTNNIDVKKVENINACKDLYEKDYQYQSTAIKLTNTPFINLFYFSLSILVMAINEIKFNFNNKKRKIN